MIGSFVTGVGTSVETGSDSVESAVGNCAPAPELFITDSASLETGSYSLETATEPPACAPEPPQPFPGPVHWQMADRGVTKNGSNEVSLWTDQSGNNYDCLAQDPFGNPTPPSNHPVWIPNEQNGLPGLDWGTWDGTPANTRWVAYNGILGFDTPFAQGAARTILAVCKPNSVVGGTLISYRRTAPLMSLRVWATSGFQVVGVDDIGNFWDRGVDAGHPVVIDYSGIPTVFAWAMEAVSSGVQKGIFYVNGVPQAAFFSPAPGLSPDNSTAAGYSLGYDAATAYTGPAFSGIIYEEIGYNGNNPDIVAQTNAYLMFKWGIAP